MKQKIGPRIVEYAKVIFIALSIAFLIRGFVCEPFKIPSGSMKPNLLIGDHLVVTKYPYGYGNYSLNFSRFNLKKSFFEASPKRGDIVVFRSKNINDTKSYIKRVIGLPGEEIQLIGGVVHINDVPVKLEKVEGYIDYNQSGQNITIDQYVETLPNGVRYRIIDNSINSNFNFPGTTGKYRIPNGHFFLMGDNRNHSTDSRYINQIGYIPQVNLLGRAEIIFWNSNISIWKWLFRIEKYPRLLNSLRSNQTEK